ncbi:MAG TPA: DUF4124 domain-containing protein [Steroidobacteraceae bacterium]|jgi:hypothetical protein
MRTALLTLIALAAAGSSAAAVASDVWKWVDEKGVTHYSDQPVPGAAKIEVRTGNVVGTQPQNTFIPAPDTATTPADAGPIYRNFQIVRPQEQQAFINTAGVVGVEIVIEPFVKQQHTLNLLLDGQAVQGFPRNAQSYDLKGVPRGTHSVSATVTDQNGAVIARTGSVTFTVRQESIAQPPVGPSLRPPPKPTKKTTANKVLTTQPTYGALNGGRPPIDPATNLPVVQKPAPKPKKP